MAHDCLDIRSSKAPSVISGLRSRTRSASQSRWSCEAYKKLRPCRSGRAATCQKPPRAEAVYAVDERQLWVGFATWPGGVPGIVLPTRRRVILADHGLLLRSRPLPPQRRSTGDRQSNLPRGRHLDSWPTLRCVTLPRLNGSARTSSSALRVPQRVDSGRSRSISPLLPSGHLMPEARPTRPSSALPLVAQWAEVYRRR
jgi:hypothetical protein